MKNLKKFIVSFLTVTLLLSVSAFAAPANVTDIKNKLVAAGLPDVYASEIVKYLGENGITQEQATAIRQEGVSIKNLMGSRTEATQFSPEEKEAFFTLTQSLLRKIGIDVSYTPDKKTVIFKTLDGQTLDTISKAEAINLAFTFNIDALFDVLGDIEVDKDGSGQVLGATEMKKTATNNGNVLMAGVAIMALAAVAYSVSRKRVLA